MATKAIVGEKVGMTQVWDDQNRAIPVTVLKVAPVRVVQVKTPETEGYSALQVTWGFRRPLDADQARASGHFAKAGVEPGRRLVELRLDDVADYAVGQELTADLLGRPASGSTPSPSRKGKGFAGGMKRHNFKGQGASHGNHKKPPRRRARSAPAPRPSRVFKGTRMAGQMGGQQVTALNLEVVSGRPRARAGPGQGGRARGPGRRRRPARLGQGARSRPGGRR